MNFRDATMGLIAKEQPDLHQRLAKEAELGERHPRAWRAAENQAIRKYKRQTGKTAGGPGFDWDMIKAWLKTALPLILKVLLMFL